MSERQEEAKVEAAAGEPAPDPTATDPVPPTAEVESAPPAEPPATEAPETEALETDKVAPPDPRDALAALSALRASPSADALAVVARRAVQRALHADRPEAVREAARSRGLAAEGATTPWGNALAVLERGPEDTAERALAAALAALAFGAEAKDGTFDADRLARDLFTLGARTDLDATALVDVALDDRAGAVWAATAKLLRRFDAAEAGALDRGAATLAALALASSPSDAAMRRRERLSDLADAGLRAVLCAAAATPEERFDGELGPAPRSAVATVLLAITGLLALGALGRLVLRFVLGLRRPAEITVGATSVLVRTKTILVGRILREREIVLPREGLGSAAREVRFPSLGLYAGLVALVLGSYVGAGVLTDGVRAASPSLLGTGLAVLLAGIVLDFVLSSLAPGARGRCRVVFRPRRGAAVCIEGADPKRADAALLRLRA